MCFSATASFGAAAVLGTIGTVSATRVTTHSQKPFAFIPLLFALQQVSEGILWLSLSHDSMFGWKTPATYFFLFFAQFLWIWWIPWSIYLLEQNQARKKWLFGTFVVGLFCAAMLGYRLMFYGVFVGIEHHHIHYDIGSTQNIIMISSALYVIAIIVPFFISSVPRIKWLGSILVFSLIIARIFYKVYFISVWCFFAALLSVTIIYIVNLLHKEAPAEKQFNGFGSDPDMTRH